MVEINVSVWETGFARLFLLTGVPFTVNVALQTAYVYQ